MASIESILRKTGWSEDYKIRHCRSAVASKPSRYGDLLDAIVHPDPYVRITAAKIADSISQEDPEVVNDFKNVLIYKVAKVEQTEVRRYVIRIVPRMDLSEREYVDVAHILREYVLSYDDEILDACREAIAHFLQKDYPESIVKRRFFHLLQDLQTRADAIAATEEEDPFISADPSKAPQLFPSASSPYKREQDYYETDRRHREREEEGDQKFPDEPDPDADTRGTREFSY
ncbi:MAG: hypothetical protein ABW189_04545 [Rickettsiales bacterium]